MEKILKIDGMMCNHCKTAVEEALRKTDGVTKVEVSLEEKCAKVIFDEEKCSLNMLKTVIEDQGFDVI